jgi:threonine dehydratase
MLEQGEIMSQIPLTFQDVLSAEEAIRPFLRQTPLVTYPALNALVGAQVYVKREDCQPISSFKIRGGINLLAHMSTEERARGLITASSGNHGQSIAYAAQLFQAHCRVVLPEKANPLKVEAIRHFGAEVIFHGTVFDDALEYAESVSEREGLRYVHVANEPALLAGVGTEALEVMQEVPDLDAFFVPIGGGSTAAGACIVRNALSPATKIIGVQSAQARAAYLSWERGEILESPMESEAEGLATRVGYELTQAILREFLDEFLLVQDQDLKASVRVYLEKCHALAEMSGAAALAGLTKVCERFRGGKVGVVLSGANITLSQIQKIFQEAE